MTKRILHLTDPNFNFSQVDPQSILLSRALTDLPGEKYHTSLGDLSVDNIIKIFPQFDQIKLETQGFDQTSDIYKESLLLYNYLSKRNPNIDFEIQQFTNHPGIRDKLDLPTLWIFGCSHSYGIGLRPNERNYGQLLAEHLNMPLKLIAQPGSSTHWSYRHLFNSPINQQDIVIWQLTTPERLTQFTGFITEEIMLNSTKDRKLIDSITLEQLYFNQITLLNTGVKFLRSIGCKFVLTSITDFGCHYDYVFEYIKYPEYCPTYRLNLDNGTDGMHAGPLSHKAIALRILDHIQLKND